MRKHHPERGAREEGAQRVSYARGGGRRRGREWAQKYPTAVGKTGGSLGRRRPLEEPPGAPAELLKTAARGRARVNLGVPRIVLPRWRAAAPGADIFSAPLGAPRHSPLCLHGPQRAPKAALFSSPPSPPLSIPAAKGLDRSDAKVQPRGRTQRCRAGGAKWLSGPFLKTTGRR